jgi:hypothetical protein
VCVDQDRLKTSTSFKMSHPYTQPKIMEASLTISDNILARYTQRYWNASVDREEFIKALRRWIYHYLQGKVDETSLSSLEDLPKAEDVIKYSDFMKRVIKVRLDLVLAIRV